MKFVKFIFRLPMAWFITVMFILLSILTILSHTLKWVAKLIVFDFKPKYANDTERRVAFVKLMDEIKELGLKYFDGTDGE